MRSDLAPKVAGIRGVTLAAALVAALTSFAGCRERTDPNAHSTAVAPRLPGVKQTAEPTHLYGSAPSSFTQLIASARHGVVSIRAATPVKSGPAAMFPGAPESTADISLGTGFLIEARGVYVVTTDTIASAATDVRVVLDDTTEVPAKVIGRDVDLDIALLSVDRPRLTPLPMGSSRGLKVGEWIVVLGNPFGEEITASAGLVSSTGREAAGSLMQNKGMSYRTFRLFLQTDARIHRGNSGGPVLDTAGQVVGMAVATGDRPGELSFALPIDRIREVVDSLRDQGRIVRSWLGVKVKPVTSDLTTTLGVTAGGGAYVTEVVTASPAIKSGLRAGDVILRWNETPVDNSTLPWIVASTAPGRPNNVAVWRNRAEIVISVVTEKMPE